MAEKQSNKDRLKEITVSIEDGIKELFQSENYARYLTTMSRFHRYSVNNQVLIHMQKPDATLVAGFNKWKDQFGRNVIKGEHGIKIIAPTPFKKKIEQEKLDPDTQLPILDVDGKVVTEEKTIQIPMYRAVTVFDVSQTEGKPLPQLAHDLVGNVANYENFMEALRRSSPVPISIEVMNGKMDGYFDLEHQDIAIRKGMSEVQTVSAVIHEMAHALLHNRTKEAEQPAPTWKVVMVSDGGTKHDFSSGYQTVEAAKNFAESENWHHVDENQFEWRLEVEEDSSATKVTVLSRNTEETQAESISYAVCAYYGIATGENSFGYIASWSKDKTLPELRESLEIINKTAGRLIDDIDRHYAEILKERETELIASEPAGTDERLFTVDDKYLYIQRTDTGVDYTFYDKASLTEFDGGQLDMEAVTLAEAAIEVCKSHEISQNSLLQLTDIGILEKIQAVQDVAIAIEPPVEEAPELPTDIPPDPAISAEARNAFGYTDDAMLPLTKERAMELFERDVPVYLLYGDNTETMAFEQTEILNHDGIFGIDRSDWEAVKEQFPIETENKWQKAFLENPSDNYCIYQLKRTDDTAELLFMSCNYLKEHDLDISYRNYDAVYAGQLSGADSPTKTLDDLYMKFNTERPQDFTGHSLSVSDIVVLRQNGVVSCHYVDSVGFADVPAFLPENYLKNEIDAALSAGSSIEGGKGRIYSYFTENHSTKEKAEFLKTEYGIGGHSHAVSGSDHSGEDHSAKGMKLQKAGCADVELNWMRVVERITTLIRKDRYLTPEQKEQLAKRKEEAELSRYDLGYGAMGNGLTVWNRKEEENGDYKTVAHIDADCSVTFYDDNLPDAIREQIQEVARTAELSVSATQDMPVFHNQAEETTVQEVEHTAGAEHTAPTVEKPVTSEEIQQALIRWNGSFESKSAVQDYMTVHGRERGTAQWLKEAYGGGDTFSVTTDHGTLELPWLRVQRNLWILVNEGRFFTEADRMLAQAAQTAAQSEEISAEPANVGTASEEPESVPEPEPASRIQSNDDLIGAELTMDGRRFVIDEIHENTASLRDITFQNGTGFPIFRNEPVDRVRSILYPEQTSVPSVNLEATVTTAQLDILHPQLDEAGIDYLVVSSGYNSRTISFSSEHYQAVQDMLDALPEEPQYTAEQEAVYPGEHTGLPYDIVVERLRTEPEHTPPANNFRILDDDLGTGGAKEKFWRNIKAIATLKLIENENRNATQEEQHILSQYVGWGGLADSFDESKTNWSVEFQELRSALTPEEYEAARSSTLNLSNVEALRSSQPKDLDASEIEVRLGATWIDQKYIQQFMEETFEPPYYLRRNIQVLYSPFTAEWSISGKSTPSYSDVNAYMTYGTDRANAYRILEDTLNLRDVRIYDTKTDPDGKERRVLNSKETTLAQQKQQAIKDAFAEWIWKDPDRRHELVTKYNELFNSNRPREYDGRHISFSGMNPEIHLREHQLNAVAHILYGGNTLLAHEVGAGKTFEMVAAAMESRRLGLCHKPMFVVPNHLTEQWASEFLRLYPSANILAATKKDFEPKNRKKFCARIATGDYDAIIIGHSQFERILVSMERQERSLREQIDEVTEGIEELKSSRAERFTIKSMERTKKGLETKLCSGIVNL